MANPQPDEFTKIANEIMDAFMRTNFSAHERRLLDCILRNTYGWGRKSDRIAYSIFEKSTGIDHRHIGRSLKSLKERNIITVTGKGYMLEYGLQKDYELWDSTPNGAPNLHQTGHQIDTVSGTKSTPNGAPILKTVGKDLTPFQDILTPFQAPNLTPFGAHIKERKKLSKKDTSSNLSLKELFYSFKDSNGYKDIDFDNEFQKFTEYWINPPKRPKLACHNWLDKAVEYKKRREPKHEPDQYKYD